MKPKALALSARAFLQPLTTQKSLQTCIYLCFFRGRGSQRASEKATFPCPRTPTPFGFLACREKTSAGARRRRRSWTKGLFAPTPWASDEQRRQKTYGQGKKWGCHMSFRGNEEHILPKRHMDRAKNVGTICLLEAREERVSRKRHMVSAKNVATICHLAVEEEKAARKRHMV